MNTPPTHRAAGFVPWETALARAEAIRHANAWRRRWWLRHALPLAWRIRGELHPANDNRTGHGNTHFPALAGHRARQNGLMVYDGDHQ